MRVCRTLPVVEPRSNHCAASYFCPLPAVILALLLSIVALPVRLQAQMQAQSIDRVTQAVDPADARTLRNHHPLWAVDANDLGAAPDDLKLDQLTLVLSRSPQQEQAFQQFLADQQNPDSPDFHHWLSADEVGQRFGLSDDDLAAVRSWLESEGLHVNWISPSRTFIGFGGTAADVDRAFQSELHYYSVNGNRRLSVSSDPTIPRALSPVIQAVRGLYSIAERPAHFARLVQSNQSAAPQFSTGGDQFISPADFATLYNLPSNLNGAGVTIGIVGWSFVDTADLDNFRQKTGTSFPNPTEIVPTAFGGVNPGAAYTTAQSCSGCLGGQEEATLDVLRAGSVAQNANLLLVSSAQSGANDGIGADAQYLIQTTPAPAQIINISFGDCEADAGSSGVAYWNNLFEQAAAEGISVFVSSGDSGAAGCDTAFAGAPGSPAAISPNYICASPYATCVGGTEFNDQAEMSEYWNAGNGAGLESALGYIPEGGWNEPLSPASALQVAASGGGVSSYVATPAWQVSASGVPAAHTGRYTPDLAFSASCREGYFGCLAADGGSCIANSSGNYSFVTFCGTSAAAPGMAGIAALLDQKLAGPAGNLNPELYAMQASAPAVFHDVTAATSGVSGCDLATPSPCNNSVPAAGSLTGGQAGYLVGAGYDEVTGLGSLNVQAFISSFSPAGRTIPQVALSLSASTITPGQALAVTITVNAASGDPAPTGAVVLSSGAYSSPAVDLASGVATVTIPACVLSAGADTLTATYTPDTESTAVYSPSTGTAAVTVAAAAQQSTTPTVSVSLSSSGITTAQSATATVRVTGTSGSSAPAGTVILASGSYSSNPAVLTSGTASIAIPAGALASGTDTLTATYLPGGASASLYNSAQGIATISVATAAHPGFTLSATAVTVSPGATNGNTSTIVITPSQGFTGTVALTAQIVSSPANIQSQPTISFGSTSPVSITGASSGTATLTIATTAPAVAALRLPAKTFGRWYSGGGATLACLLLFWPRRRWRNFRNLLGAVALLAALSCGASGCSGKLPSAGAAAESASGTSAGSYVVAVTGTSGSNVATAQFTLTVQ